MLNVIEPRERDLFFTCDMQPCCVVDVIVIVVAGLKSEKTMQSTSSIHFHRTAIPFCSIFMRNLITFLILPRSKLFPSEDNLFVRTLSQMYGY